MSEQIRFGSGEFNPQAELIKGPVDAVLALGMGPVRPQLRWTKIEIGKNKHGKPDYNKIRRPIADFERMRAISIFVKELIANGYISEDGFIIPSGRATANAEAVQKAFQDSSQASDAGLGKLLAQERSDPDKQREKPFQLRQRYWGRPKSQEEVDLIMQTFEAGLMTDLITRTVAKPGARDRKSVPEKNILSETEAVNSNQNTIRAINLLDRQAGGVWEGTIAVVTSNFGHIQRQLELFEVLGIKNVIGLSAEQGLRHFGYDADYLDRYEALNVDRKTLTEQERWRKAVWEDAGYVLHDVQFFKNDQRLMQVMTALKEHYKPEKLAQYGLDEFESLSAEEIRNRIRKNVDRGKIVNDWLEKKIVVDEDAWHFENKVCNEETEAWLSRSKIPQTV